MVGRRFLGASDDKGSNAKKDPRNDLNGRPKLNGRERFKDIVHSVLADGRRDQMKKKLIDGLDAHKMERFRKSEDEVCWSVT